MHKKILNSKSYFRLPKDRRGEWPLLLALADDVTGIIEGSDEDIAFKIRENSWNPEIFLVDLLDEVATTGIPLATNGCVEEKRREEKRLRSGLGRTETKTPAQPEPIAALLGSDDPYRQRSGEPLGVSRFVEEIMRIEPDSRRELFWRETYQRCEKAGQIAVDAAWSALAECQRRDCHLRDKPRWIRKQIRDAGVQLPAWQAA